MALKSVFLARSCGESWLKVKNVKGNNFLSFEGKSRDSNIAELYTMNTEQCLGIEHILPLLVKLGVQHVACH